MSEISYGLSIIPAAHKANFNLVCAMYYGDPWTAQNLSRPLIADNTVNPTDTTPATHWFGGLPVGAEWTATFGPGGTLPAPAGGWPLMDGSTELLTLANAQAAWAARMVYTLTQEGDPSDLATALKDSVFPVLHLIPRPEPDL